MDERGRKRKSLWDAEDENQRISCSGKEYYSTYKGGRSHRFSSSKADNSSSMPKDHAGWPSWDTLEENTIGTKGEGVYKSGQDELEMRERVENKGCYKSVSPGFDGWGHRKHSNSSDDSLSRSRRYLEGGRNRSRERGRSRSRSPSWSKGRDHSGVRSRTTSRSRSRSRSRNRNTNSARGQTRSRSPFHEHGHDLQGWNDSSGSGRSSQTCRDFATRNCRRGSQCRFLHPDRMDRDYLQNDFVERSRSRPDRGHASAYGERRGRQSWDKGSDSNYHEDNSFRSKSRGTICCKDFMRGKCKWGASCRFSHHVDSGDINGKDTRLAPFEHDREHRTNESRKPLCKYFLAGKCHRDNCWFSHDGPIDSNHESRPRDAGRRQSLVDKNDRWKGATWDQVEPDLKVVEGSRWSESVVANQNTAAAIPLERRDNEWTHERSSLRSPELKEMASEGNNYLSTQDWHEENGGDGGAIKSVVVESSYDKQEYPLISKGNLDVVYTGSHAPNITKESSSQHPSEASLHAGVAENSDILHHPTVAEDNVVNASSFDSLGQLKGDGNTNNPEFMPGQSLNQNVIGNSILNHPLVSNDQRDNLFFPHLQNVRNIDLNGSGQGFSSTLIMQNHTGSHQKEAAKTPEIQEFGAPRSFFNNASNNQVPQNLLSPAAAAPMQKLVAEQTQTHLHAALNHLTSTALVSALETAIQIQPKTDVRSPVQLDPLGDGRGKLGNVNQTSGELPYSYEQKNGIPFEEFSPMSGDNPQFGNTLVSNSSNRQCHESPESKQQEAPAASEVKDNNTESVVECQKGQEDLHQENGDEHVKVGNGNNHKDDKDMRFFKNALIEFVKETLKPTWKEGRMSREVHKTIVKKVVDKVTSTMQDHIPKTQGKTDQYLSHSKPKITKLVQAYVERHLKTDS